MPLESPVNLLRLTAPVAAATAALLAFTLPASAAPATDPIPPEIRVQVVVALCASVSVDQVDELLAQLRDVDLVEQLAPLAPITVPGVDPAGLVLDVTADIDDVHVALGCAPATTTPPVTTVPPTTTVAPTTDVPPPATSTTETSASAPTTTPADEPVDPDGDGITQVRVTPQGGVATGDGSLAA